MKRAMLALVFSCVTSLDFAEANTYRAAIVRALSSSFENSLKTNPPLTPIDVELAKKQHEAYSQLIEKLVGKVFRMKADENHPDCNFIEDTAIIVGNTAVISRMGALERRGEETPVAEVLKTIEGMKVFHLQSPATMDGGDVLYTGKHLFVGLSKRTNEDAIVQLKDIFREKLEVVGINVVEGLHLKSVISLFDSKILVVSSSSAGKNVRDQIQKLSSEYKFVPVPDMVASNVLRIGSTLIVQDGFPQSEKILKTLADAHNVALVKLNMSELVKADGALTCGSLLLE